MNTFISRLAPCATAVDPELEAVNGLTRSGEGERDGDSRLAEVGGEWRIRGGRAACRDCGWWVGRVRFSYLRILGGVAASRLAPWP